MRESSNSESQPRIAVYLHTLFNGGIERVMINLIRGFLDKGISVDLVVDFLIYSPFVDQIPAGTNVVNLGALKSMQRLPRFVAYLRRTRPQAVVSATHMANEVACVAKRITRSPARLILTEHGNLSSDIHVSGSYLRKLILPLTTRLLYPLSNGAVAVSNGVAEDLCRVSRLRRDLVQTIYNPIDFKELRALADEPLGHPWFVPGGPPVILAIGRLEDQKNFASLINAFSIVRKERKARLLILGEGSRRDQLSGLIKKLGLEDDVSLPGFVVNPAKYMARCQVFTMSSSWEGFGMALVEALSLGVPVISTDCPNGPSEILDGGKYGELIPMDDSKAMAVAIGKLLDGHKKCVPEEWLRQFDSDVITAKYTALLLPNYSEIKVH